MNRRPFAISLMALCVMAGLGLTGMAAAREASGPRNKNIEAPKQGAGKPTASGLVNNENIPAPGGNASDTESASKETRDLKKAFKEQIKEQEQAQNCIKCPSSSGSDSGSFANQSNVGNKLEKGVVANPDGTGDLNKPQL
jgi:hypothetical protein